MVARQAKARGMDVVIEPFIGSNGEVDICVRYVDNPLPVMAKMLRKRNRQA